MLPHDLSNRYFILVMAEVLYKYIRDCAHA